MVLKMYYSSYSVWELKMEIAEREEARKKINEDLKELRKELKRAVIQEREELLNQLNGREKERLYKFHEACLKNNKRYEKIVLEEKQKDFIVLNIIFEGGKDKVKITLWDKEYDITTWWGTSEKIKY